METSPTPVKSWEVWLAKLGIVRASRYHYLLNKYIETEVENQRLTQMLDWTHDREDLPSRIVH